MKTSRVYGCVFSLLVMLGWVAGARGEEANPADRVATGAIVEGFGTYGRSLVSAMMALTDQMLAQELRTLAVLAQTPAVRSGAWEKMHEALKSSQGDRPLGIIWFAKPDGSYFTGEAGGTEQNLSDRPYFPALMAGQSVPGVLVISKSTGKKSVVVAVPVKEGDKVIGALGTSLFLDRFSQRVEQALALPPSMVFYCLNPDGPVILHRDARYIFEDPRRLNSESLRIAAEKMLADEAVDVHYEFAGYQRRVVCRASPVTHWRFAVGINTGVVANPPGPDQ